MDSDTIFALSSGSGKAGIAVFRISGSRAFTTLESISGLSKPVSRQFHKVTIRNEETNDVLDKGLAVCFTGPKSYTGEDIVELHVHGGPSIIDEITNLLSTHKGLRLAEPGEFTRRAFENEKFDLTVAEGLADLINSETMAQRKQAQRLVSGELSVIYGSWREKILTAMALVEAEIDFSDEDLPEGLGNQARSMVSETRSEISSFLLNSDSSRLIRDGIHIAIIGAPNAGKSSLLNCLARRDVAIVSERAGTTRDVIEVHCNLGGYSVTVADTAGLRKSSDIIEKEGVKRAIQQANTADLRLVLFDGKHWPTLDNNTLEWVSKEGETISVLNKVDLVKEKSVTDRNQVPQIGISALTGEGVDELLELIIVKITQLCQASASASLIRVRHVEALTQAEGLLNQYFSDASSELAAENLRLASRALGKITGIINVDEILDVIFRDFCIGK
ncbi:MAG: tRNA uridine-5-carboxymethylaminomethyl(34) synthesis GTPase MnmE [Pseudomonadota bacterium]|nr:tRNA uridine-5-carboxymethylaminomethyl(34) synthesis GTPase MnmE [Pseudomonadota bacterium]